MIRGLTCRSKASGRHFRDSDRFETGGSRLVSVTGKDRQARVLREFAIRKGELALHELRPTVRDNRPCMNAVGTEPATGSIGSLAGREGFHPSKISSCGCLR